MAFERLQALGEDRFRFLINALIRGETAMGLARIVQQDWKEFTDVGSRTLTQQLNRLRLAAAEGMFGKAVAAEIEHGAKPHIRLLEGISSTVLDRMEELAILQRSRCTALVAKEKAMINIPSTPLLNAMNAVFSEYRETLVTIQKMRFDLGADEFKGPMTGMGMRGAASSVTLPDGTNIQRQVFEAVTTLEDIFTRRGVPPPSDQPLIGG